MLDKIINLFKNTVDNYVKSRIRIRLPLLLATTPKKIFLVLHFNDVPCSKSSLSNSFIKLSSTTVTFEYSLILWIISWIHFFTECTWSSYAMAAFWLPFWHLPAVYTFCNNPMIFLRQPFLKNASRNISCKLSLSVLQSSLKNHGDVLLAQAYYFHQYWHADSRARYLFQFIGKYLKYIVNALLNQNIISSLCHEDLRILYILIIEYTCM